jgi:hypothetical protein
MLRAQMRRLMWFMRISRWERSIALLGQGRRFTRSASSPTSALCEMINPSDSRCGFFNSWEVGRYTDLGGSKTCQPRGKVGFCTVHTYDCKVKEVWDFEVFGTFRSLRGHAFGFRCFPRCSSESKSKRFLDHVLRLSPRLFDVDGRSL